MSAILGCATFVRPKETTVAAVRTCQEKTWHGKKPVSLPAPIPSPRGGAANHMGPAGTKNGRGIWKKSQASAASGNQTSVPVGTSAGETSSGIVNLISGSEGSSLV